MNMSRWIDYFVFDVTEDLAFNKSSNMLRDGVDAYIFKTIRADMWNIAFFSRLPWLLPFLKITPILNREYLKFWDWIQNQLTERIKVCAHVCSHTPHMMRLLISFWLHRMSRNCQMCFLGSLKRSTMALKHYKIDIICMETAS